MEHFRIARKPHACYWCGRDIKPGQGYWDCGRIPARHASDHYSTNDRQHAECVDCGPEDQYDLAAQHQREQEALTGPEG